MSTEPGPGPVAAGDPPTTPPQVALLYRKVLAGETGLAQYPVERRRGEGVYVHLGLEPVPVVLDRVRVSRGGSE